MPIDIETFESESGFDDGISHGDRILRFLAANDDKAFRRGEIADATGLDPNVVSGILSRLKERELVRHKPPYWALGDRERVRTASNVELTLSALNEELGREDMDEWREASREAREQ